MYMTMPMKINIASGILNNNNNNNNNDDVNLEDTLSIIDQNYILPRFGHIRSF